MDLSSEAAQLNGEFDVSQYVPPEIQSDYQTGKQYYDQFSAASGVGLTIVQGKYGPDIIPSDSITNAALTGATIALQAVPVLGPLWALFMALKPNAGAGPGLCVTDPPSVRDPKHPTPTELRAWSHFTPWNAMNAPYTLTPGTFEAYANPVLQWNWELASNCFSNLWVPSSVLLATLIASWNATHKGSPITVSRCGLNMSGFDQPPAGCIRDPITLALEESVLGESAASLPSSGTATWGQAEAQTDAAPHNATRSFQVNTGPEVAPGASPYEIHLSLKPPATAQPLALTSGSKVALSAAIVGGSAAAGVGIWALLTKQGYGEAWSRIWKASGGKLLR